jgi:hypothetical protein
MIEAKLIVDQSWEALKLIRNGIASFHSKLMSRSFTPTLIHMFRVMACKYVRSFYCCVENMYCPQKHVTYMCCQFNDKSNIVRL